MEQNQTNTPTAVQAAVERLKEMRRDNNAAFLGNHSVNAIDVVLSELARLQQENERLNSLDVQIARLKEIIAQTKDLESGNVLLTEAYARIKELTEALSPFCAAWETLPEEARSIDNNTVLMGLIMNGLAAPCPIHFKRAADVYFKRAAALKGASNG